MRDIIINTKPKEEPINSRDINSNSGGLIIVYNKDIPTGFIVYANGSWIFCDSLDVDNNALREDSTLEDLIAQLGGNNYSYKFIDFD